MPRSPAELLWRTPALGFTARRNVATPASSILMKKTNQPQTQKQINVVIALMVVN